jgi:3',5'-cyclic AMP phosphodiesterase CpdA
MSPKETLNNCLHGILRYAHGAQKPRHIQRYVAHPQRSDSPAQAIIQRFLKYKIYVVFVVLATGLSLPVTAQTVAADISNIVLTPGRTESELNFAWRTPKGNATEAAAQIALKSDMTGADFPEGKAQTFKGISADFADGHASHKATASRLLPSTSYIYRLTGQSGNWSDVYEFSTRDGEIYSVLLFGDIQIGSKNIDDDTAAWRDTLEKAVQTAPDAAFALSVGDQVNTSASQGEYDGLLSLSQFKNLPFVPTIGNHDNHKLFSHHFNIPDENPTFGTTAAGGDYFFTYGSALFIVVNSNSTNYAHHKAFIRDAVKKRPKAHWRIVIMHHSIYGADIARSTSLELRENLVPVFDRYGIDAALAGHDHIYVRTHFMRNNQVVKPPEKLPTRAARPAEILDGAAIKPFGTLYITAATSSGSKYYDPASEVFDYLAERAAYYVPMFSRINITNTSFEIITYRTDSMAVTDRFAMVKAEAPSGMRVIIAILIAVAAVLGAAAAVIIGKSVCYKS